MAPALGLFLGHIWSTHAVCFFLPSGNVQRTVQSKIDQMLVSLDVVNIDIIYWHWYIDDIDTAVSDVDINVI